MEHREDDYLNLSGIQHFAFCRRQWAMIHIEQQWQENYRTIAGEIMHERVHDDTIREKRKGVIVSRGMMISSRTLGINGVCDIVEFHQKPSGIQIFGYEGLYEVIPVEYKRGEPKLNNADELQLCAQALCLEEMLCCDIPKGYLYYGECRRRYCVEMTQELRKKVTDITKEMHEYYERRYTPKVKRTKACNACSLKEICIPQLGKPRTISNYFNEYLE